MPRPTVTIAIAAYKSAPEHLAAAVESALRQTWQNVEVLVSDDSPDPALREVVERFNDPRVTYQHNSPRLGVALNHWSAFRAAKGEFIAVLNHDDRFEDTFLERLTPPLIDDPRLALAFCDQWVIDTDGRRSAEFTDRFSATWSRADLPAGVILPFFHLFASQSIPLAAGAVFRRDLLPEHFPAEAGPAYDLWLAYLLCRHGHGAYYVPERLSSWRVHDSNLTGQGNAGWFLGTATCWEEASKDPNLAAIRPTLRQHAAFAYSTCAVRAWRAGQPADCRRNAWRSLRMHFTWKGAAVCLLPFLPKSLADRLAARSRPITG